MTTAQDIFAYLTRLAPLAFAEGYDNPGFLVGERHAVVTSALVALDVTPEVCAEASETGAQLVVSHHPVIFHPVGAVLAEGPTRPVWELARRGLSAICMHTNLDAAFGGVNDALIETVGLSGERVLLPRGREKYKKLIVFVPAGYEERVREAMTKAGAGSLGDYDSCAFASKGDGYFRPLDGAKPFIGRAGELAKTGEIRLEAVCAAENADAVVAAVRSVHPYETPAFDVIDDEGPGRVYGIGRLALLPEPMKPEDFARHVSRALRSGGARLCLAGGEVLRVAVCSGAWDRELTRAAEKAGADTVLTGEIKHSDMLEALGAGLNVVAAGHYATEAVIRPRLRDALKAEFGGVSFAVSAHERSPESFLSEQE